MTEQDLFRSANFTLSVLPTRLAHRIRALRNLPYIVVSNPHISQIHHNYVHSLSAILPWAERKIDAIADETAFTEVLAEIVSVHANTISVLAQGFVETRKYISGEAITRFLDEHLRARIGTRLVAEQHIALHYASRPHQSEKDSFIGVIDPELQPAAIVRQCEGIVGDMCELRYGVRPAVVMTGVPDYGFAHIPVHLEYIITELLKNAFRATIEHGTEREPVEVTIAPLPEVPGADVRDSPALSTPAPAPGYSGTDAVRPLARSTPGVTIRIRDRGGGIAPAVLPHIWDYSFTTFDDEQALRSGTSPGVWKASDHGLSVIAGAGGDAVHSIAGLGYGLPLSRAYAEYFGGGIAVQSLWGWGTDVYLSLRGVGRVF